MVCWKNGSWQFFRSLKRKLTGDNFFQWPRFAVVCHVAFPTGNTLVLPLPTSARWPTWTSSSSSQIRIYYLVSYAHLVRSRSFWTMLLEWWDTFPKSQGSMHSGSVFLIKTQPLQISGWSGQVFCFFPHQFVSFITHFLDHLNSICMILLRQKGGPAFRSPIAQDPSQRDQLSGAVKDGKKLSLFQNIYAVRRGINIILWIIRMDEFITFNYDNAVYVYG